MTSRSTLWTLPLIVGAAAVATVVLHLALRPSASKTPQRTRPRSSQPPVISHLILQCRNLEASLQFYQALGFLLVSRTPTSILLSIPKSNKYAPYVLLEQIPPDELEDDDDDDENVSEAWDGTMAGYGRMAILVPSIVRCSNHLKKTLNLEPIAKPATDMIIDPRGRQRGTLTVAAWRDPDGTLIEVAETHDPQTRRMLSWMQLLGVLEYPLWLHVNINTVDYAQSYKAYQQLGFVKVADHGRVRNKLYKPLGIADPGIARQATMFQLPQDNLQLNIVEWEDPKTVTPPGGIRKRGLVRLAVATRASIERIPVGWEAPTKDRNSESRDVLYPAPLGRAKARTLLDPDGIEVDLVQF